jgi:hypothetical protein
MKRKLALLLALIMVLSMVPANVFARIPGSVGGRVHQPTTLANPAFINLTMDAGHLRGPAVPYDIFIDLTGQTGGNRPRFMPFNPGLDISPDGLVATPTVPHVMEAYTLRTVPFASRASANQNGAIGNHETLEWNDLAAFPAMTAAGINSVVAWANASANAAATPGALVAFVNGWASPPTENVAFDDPTYGWNESAVWNNFVRQINFTPTATRPNNFPNGAPNPQAGNSTPVLPGALANRAPVNPGTVGTLASGGWIHPDAALAWPAANGWIGVWFDTEWTSGAGAAATQGRAMFQVLMPPSNASAEWLPQFATLRIVDPIPAGIQTVVFDIPLPIHIPHAENRLTARLMNPTTGQIVADDYLTQFTTGGVVIAPGATRYFLETVHLDAITITEGHRGAMPLNVPRTIRLTAPVGYSWLLPPPSIAANFVPSANGAVGPGNSPYLHAGARQSFMFSGMNFEVYTTIAGQEELVIRTNISRVPAGSPAYNLPGIIEIRHLGLQANWGTNPDRDLYVNVRVGNRDPGPGTLPGVAGMPDGAARDQAIRMFDAQWVNGPTPGATNNILVARHRSALLSLSTLEETLPELRSGYVIGVQPQPWGTRPIVETTAPWTVTAPQSAMVDGRLTTGRTAILRVQENVVNALDVARLRPVTFEVPEGVIITGIEWRYYEGAVPTGTQNAQWNGQFPNRDIAGQPVVPRGRGRQAPRPALDQPQTADGGNVIFYNDQTVILRPDLTLHNVHANRLNTLRLEVRFYVSVASGFQHNVSDELMVTVTGAGVNNLPEEQNTIAVATVFDPVTIEHIGGQVDITAIGREQNVYHTPAGAVIVTETEGGMLQRGTRLWLQIIRQYAPGGSPLAISRGDVFTDATGNLGLTVREVTPPVILGGQATQRFQVEVTRESLPGNPGSITFDDLTLFGHVYQGERYFFLVSGPAIAENHYGVTSTAFTVVPGIFAEPPFAMEIIDMSGVDAPINHANSLAGVTFTTGVSFRGVENPILWRRLPGMDFEGGFVSMRAFALAAGVEESNIVWNNANRIATISGYNYQGQWVVVSVSPDTARATITTDGTFTEVDIAMVAGDTGPEGTVRPIHENDRIYLPLRFMFNVFGYTDFYNLARQGQSAVITAK